MMDYLQLVLQELQLQEVLQPPFKVLRLLQLELLLKLAH
jgi:hypothetical protein